MSTSLCSNARYKAMARQKLSYASSNSARFHAHTEGRDEWLSIVVQLWLVKIISDRSFLKGHPYVTCFAESFRAIILVDLMAISQIQFILRH